MRTNAALQEAQRQMEAADKAMYSPALDLQAYLAEQGIKATVKQAHVIAIATDTDLKARLEFRERQLAAMLPCPESHTKRGIIQDINWAISCLRTELDRRSSLAAAAE